MKNVLNLTIMGLLILSLVSCDEDEEQNSTTSEGNILVATAIGNANGTTGSYYLQLLDNLDANNINNSNAYPEGTYVVPIINGDDIFALPSYGGTSILTKYTRVGGEMVKTGEYTLEEQSGATGAVIKDDLMYISLHFVGKILVLKHADLSFVKEIDISSYGVGDNNPDPTCMVLRDNYLFVSLNQLVGGPFPAEDRPYTDMLIINTDNDEVVKMITDNASGISTGARAIDPHSMFMDESGDIYLVCLGAYGAVSGHASGILRVKLGETEFDEDYQFVTNTTSIEGDDNTLSYLTKVKYYGGGKLYASAEIPAYYGDPVNYLTDRVIVSVEVDLDSKTIKKLDLPGSNSFAQSVTIYDNKAAFGLATDTDNGIYTYNIATKEASTNAVIKTDGAVTILDVFE